MDVAIKKKSRRATFWSVKGVFLLKLHRFDEALKCIDTSIKLNSKTSSMWNPKGLFFSEQGQYEEALKIFDKALNINSENIYSMFYKSEALAKLGRYEDALECCDNALKISPKSPEAWFYRGLVLAEMGEFEEALESYDKSLCVNPRDLDVLNSRIKILNHLKQEYSPEDYKRLIDNSIASHEFDKLLDRSSLEKQPEGDGVKCPSCGKTIAIDNEKCPECGFKLKRPIDLSEPLNVTVLSLFIISLFSLGSGGYFLLEKPKMGVAMILLLIIIFKVFNPPLVTFIIFMVALIMVVTVHQYIIIKGWKDEMENHKNVTS